MESVSTRCDLHVLLVGDHKQYHEECLDSLIDEPAALHVIPGVWGDVGIGRWKGYHSGYREFVTFVDDDDCLAPGAVQRCIDILDKDEGAIGVHTREWVISGGAMTLSPIPDPEWHWTKYSNTVHHLVMYRRDLVMDYVDQVKDCRAGGERYMNALIMSDGYRFAYDLEPGYIWRRPDDITHSIRQFGITPPFDAMLRDLVKRGIRDAAT